MSKPRYHWWAYAKAIVRMYPQLKREYEALHTQRITGDPENVRGGKGGVSRSVEITALRQLPPARQKEYDAVTKAIELTQRLPSGETRLAFVDLVFWKQTHKVESAALKLYISESTARRYHTEFIRLVGFCYGLEDVTEGE